MFFQHFDVTTSEPITKKTVIGHRLIRHKAHTFNSLSKSTKKIPVVEYETVFSKLSNIYLNAPKMEVMQNYHEFVMGLNNPIALRSWQRLLSLYQSYKPYERVVGTYTTIQDSVVYLIETQEQFMSAMNADINLVYCDTETTGLKAYKGSVRMLQFGYIVEGTLRVFLCPGDVVQWQQFSDWLQGKSVVFHNLKFDMHQLVAQGVDLLHPSITLVDTMIMYRTYYPGILIGMSGLNDIVKGQYGIELDKRYQKLSFNRDSYCLDMVDYAASDILALYIVHSNFVNYYKALEHLDQVVNGFPLFYSMEMETLKIVYKMEAKGVQLDSSLIADLEQEFSTKIADIKDYLVEILNAKSGRTDSNPNSPMQVMSAMKVSSTQASELEKLLALNTTSEELKEFIKKFIEYKSLVKLMSFITALPLEVNPDTQKIHASFNHSGTSTGRFSCSSPNLQQIPRDARMRKLFKASPGCKLIVADYGQIELVLAAQITKDETLCNAYKSGLDVHKLTASRLMGKDISEVTKQDRQLAKAVNFGLAYGMGAKKLVIYAETSYEVKMTLEEAEKFRNIYLNDLYPGLKDWHTRSSQEMNYYIQPPSVTLMGRSRLFRHPALGSHQGGIGFSAYVNAQDQGSGADIIKIALMTYEQLVDSSKAYPIMQIHDEIVVESTEEYVQEAYDLLLKAMHYAAKVIIPDLPVTIEAHIGNNWAEAK